MRKEKTVDFHLKWTWHAVSRMYNLYAGQEDMTMSIGYVLLNIDLEKGTPATKIAPSIGMEPRSLTRTLKTLEEKGWIYRETDADDKRFVNVFLTDEGKKRRSFARKGVIAFNKTIQEKISPERMDVFMGVMNDIKDAVETTATDTKESILNKIKDAENE
ncbi:MAG: MarR family transcriptional regulator [Spirosomaceae bacterium]|nr:MarR family transcriptional regulator [Spirosomataceae bacterium]